MTKLLEKLMESSCAIPALYKEYLFSIGEREIDTSNETVKKRIIEIYCIEASVAQKQLVEELGLLYSPCVPEHIKLLPPNTIATFY